MNNNEITAEGLNHLSTMISVKDANEAVKFYVEIFGFKAHEVTNDREGNVVFARLVYKGINLMIAPPNPIEEEDFMSPPVSSNCPPQVSFYVYCDNLEESYSKAKNYGLKFLHDKEIKFWGDKAFRVLDPNGYIWNFATKFTEHDATKVPREVF